eukprot:CAMPEP_0197840812 /NCGR_PEP_ID=MMETSP1437-20131217/45823_1 /TAXON_ID=49252 ORGANISM="Eucampia antarctica, Strain CCMP1452" /NCGR_SAMPLE_ID=MMETSP1437 /ASSEMBLY_ACC=CAM_ASM_001096 /LENGTH=337 /DNA_ID=CAMNT_0043450477 /DNA_START=270 /DNA_END=1283 /DNA_ORIENTATION=-
MVLAGSSSTIPRSNPHRTTASSSSGSEDNVPPWNPSDQIGKEGFLKHEYPRLPGEWEGEANIGGRYSPKSKNYASAFAIPITVRQVPGDGNCLFHSLSTCLAHAINGTHRHMSSVQDLKDLQAYSSMLRKLAVRTLENGNKKLFLQGKEYLLARDLVEAAAAQYDMTGEQYCQLMKRDCYWGGGPEIVALCNVLQRPIHVYELVLSTHNQTHFCLRRMACFGSPKFDSKGEPLCILSADSRFPDVTPGRQLASGNHFLALFPYQQRQEEDQERQSRLQKKKKKRKKHAGGVRGGDLQNWKPKSILNDKDVRLTNFVIILEFLFHKIFQILGTGTNGN